MNNSKIEWCDYTWNPVTGCFHRCIYCYARNIANRFGGTTETAPTDDLHELNEPITDYDQKGNLMIKAYPYGFDPTFNIYRLGEPLKKKRGKNIFVGSMTDLFGEWVPDYWKKEVFLACEAAPQHNYLFLTKNVFGIPGTSYLYSGIFNKHRDNFWFGVTVTCQRDLEKRFRYLIQVQGKIFLSIEPLHSDIDLNRIETDQVIFKHTDGMAYYFGGGQKIRKVDWIIIGAETGNRKGKIIPKKGWIRHIVNDCRMAGVPVFMKSNLLPIWQEELIQEYPEGLMH